MTLPVDLPSGWAWATLEEIAHIAGGIAKGRDLTGKQALSVPYLRVANVQRGYLDLSEVKTIEILSEEHDKYCLQPGDVLFTEGGDADKLGRSVVWRGEVPGCVHQNHVFRARLITDEILPEWLTYYSNSVYGRKYFQSAAKQTTKLASINMSQLRSCPVPIPPRAEQRRIISEIEKQFSRLEAGIERIKTAGQDLKRYRIAVLNAAVEGRLVTQDPSDEPAESLLRTILSERGVLNKPVSEAEGRRSLPCNWVWTDIAALAQVGTGATPLRSQPRYWTGGTVPWVTSGALNAAYVTDASDHVTEDALAETNLTVYPKHTLLVAMYGEGKTRGKCSELLLEATTNQACAALFFEGTAALCRPFIKIFLWSNYEETRRRSSGGVQPNLNLGLIKSTPVPLPPVGEQQRIVTEVERRLSVSQQLESIISANVSRAEHLRQALLKKAISGLLVPQDPTDQPASVLMERLRKAMEQQAPAPKRRPRKSGGAS